MPERATWGDQWSEKSAKAVIVGIHADEGPNGKEGNRLESRESMATDGQATDAPVRR